jgi:hypothetical protein
MRRDYEIRFHLSTPLIVSVYQSPTCLVVCNPAPYLIEFLAADDRSRGATRTERHRQIPNRSVPLSARAFAVGVAAGDIALNQGPAQDFLRRGQKLV